MGNQNTQDEKFEKFTLKISNFSSLDSKELYSENICIDDHTWRILYRKGKNVLLKEIEEKFKTKKSGNNVDCLSIYLLWNSANLSSDPKRFAKSKFTLINEVNPKKNKVKEASQIFNGKKFVWGFGLFISLDELCDPCNGFIVNDTCIIQVEILVIKSEHENQVDQSVSKIDDKVVEGNDNPLPKVTISTSFGELVDFRGLGKVEQDFVPLLEEVCSQHPLLIDATRKRSQRFIEWAFSALGRVLHFLKTTKVRDMNEDAYNHLLTLWEELETSKFDLTWLEPHVKSALGMKTCAERAFQVKRLEENVAALEREKKGLKTKLFEAEVDLEITKRDLVKAKEGFEECDLNAALGYGGP